MVGPWSGRTRPLTPGGPGLGCLPACVAARAWLDGPEAVTLLCPAGIRIQCGVRGLTRYRAPHALICTGRWAVARTLPLGQGPEAELVGRLNRPGAGGAPGLAVGLAVGRGRGIPLGTGAGLRQGGCGILRGARPRGCLTLNPRGWDRVIFTAEEDDPQSADQQCGEDDFVLIHGSEPADFLEIPNDSLAGNPGPCRNSGGHPRGPVPPGLARADELPQSDASATRASSSLSRSIRA